MKHSENCTFIGLSSGRNNTGSDVTGIGADSLHSNTADENTAVGQKSGFSNTSGNKNTFIGYHSGESNISGDNNVYVGNLSGNSNTSGDYNTCVGTSAGYTTTDSSSCTIIGSLAGYNNTTGDYNTMVGDSAGKFNTNGNGNVFIGMRTGFPSINDGASISNNLFIDTYAKDVSPVSYSGTLSFIHGVMSRVPSSTSDYASDVRKLTINANFTVAANWVPLAGSWTTTSDKRLKKNIVSMDSAINKILKLRPVNYDWISSSKKDSGFIAQEMKEILPTIVYENSDEHYSIDYSKITPYLTKAFQEQNTIVKQMEEKINLQDIKIKKLEDLLKKQKQEIFNDVLKMINSHKQDQPSQT